MELLHLLVTQYKNSDMVLFVINIFRIFIGQIIKSIILRFSS